MTMIILALDPALKLGWATNSDGYHRGRSGVFSVDQYMADWFTGRSIEGNDKLARRLASVDRWLDHLAHHVVPDVVVVEEQPHMGRSGKGARAFQAHAQINRDIERVCIKLAGDRDLLLIRPHPSTWQAWARRADYDLDAWKEAGKPDDESARMMLAWALDTHKMEAA